MIMDELRSFKKEDAGKWVKMCCGIAVVGYLIFLVFACFSRVFLGGDVCLTASFLVALS